MLYQLTITVKPDRGFCARTVLPDVKRQVRVVFDVVAIEFEDNVFVVNATPGGWTLWLHFVNKRTTRAFHAKYFREREIHLPHADPKQPPLNDS